MIIFVITAIAAQLAQPSKASGSEFIRLLHSYQDCARSKAMQFGKADETVANTVSAALTACRSERASIVLYMNGEKKADGSERWPLEKADRFVTDLVDNPLHDELTTSLFEVRSEDSDADHSKAR